MSTLFPDYYNFYNSGRTLATKWNVYRYPWVFDARSGRLTEYFFQPAWESLWDVKEEVIGEYTYGEDRVDGMSLQEIINQLNIYDVVLNERVAAMQWRHLVDDARLSEAEQQDEIKLIEDQLKYLIQCAREVLMDSVSDVAPYYFSANASRLEMAYRLHGGKDRIDIIQGIITKEDCEGRDAKRLVDDAAQKIRPLFNYTGESDANGNGLIVSLDKNKKLDRITQAKILMWSEQANYATIAHMFVDYEGSSLITAARRFPIDWCRFLPKEEFNNEETLFSGNSRYRVPKTLVTRHRRNGKAGRVSDRVEAGRKAFLGRLQQKFKVSNIRYDAFKNFMCVYMDSDRTTLVFSEDCPDYREIAANVPKLNGDKIEVGSRFVLSMKSAIVFKAVEHVAVTEFLESVCDGMCANCLLGVEPEQSFGGAEDGTIWCDPICNEESIRKGWWKKREALRAYFGNTNRIMFRKDVVGSQFEKDWLCSVR